MISGIINCGFPHWGRGKGNPWDCDYDFEKSKGNHNPKPTFELGKIEQEVEGEFVEIVCILDKSGSMSGLENDTIGGYNSFIKKQKEQEGNAIISTILFSDKPHVIHNRVDIKKVEEITDKEYRVGGCTALLDTFGSALTQVLKIHKDNAQAKKAIFVIITDGYENASHEYTHADVKRLVEAQQEKGWEFLFLGANMDAISEGERYGFKAKCCKNFAATSEGIASCLTTVSNFVDTHR